MVSIIGGGVAGCFAGEHLAKEYEVTIYERNSTAHKTCSGIVTSSIYDIINLPNRLIQNKIHRIAVFAPSKKPLQLHLKEPDIVLHRTSFVEWLRSRAENKGCRFLENHRYNGKKDKGIEITNLHTNKKIQLNNQFIIGADGAGSRVARDNLMFSPRSHYAVIKLEARTKHNNEIWFFPFIKDFAWVSPIDKDRIEIGLATQQDVTHRWNTYLHFISKKISFKPEKKESALIPIYNPNQRLQKKNIFLVGDAGTINKPTSGGGILFGMQSAKALGKYLNSKKLKNYSIPYERLIKNTLGLHLQAHYILRQRMQTFSNKDWDRFITWAKTPSIKQILEKYNREYPAKILFPSIFKQPKFLYFAKTLLK